MVELDNLDIKILAHLLENGRRSFQEIAKSCLTSVPTVKSRVDRLLELGVIGDMQRLLSIQDRINLTDVNDIRIIPVKDAFRKVTLPLASSSITITCAYCDKKVTEGAVRKRFDDRDYFFCCNTCLGAFDEKYNKLLTGSGK